MENTVSVGTTRQFDLKMIAAFAAIYFVWGASFLAIRFALESVPPLLIVAFRTTGAGIILLSWVLIKNRERLTWRQWRGAAIGGLLFFVLCHGTLAWVEQKIPSGIAAVVMALIPIWVVLIDWLRPGGSFPGGMVLAGVGIGFGGLVLLVGPGVLSGAGAIDVGATILLALGALAWALGTLYSRYKPTGASSTTTSGMQLLAGGVMLLIGATLTGEWPTLAANTIEPRAALSILFLIVVGSVITFSAYIWLLQVSSPSRVATYAYVNPIVAVILGSLFASEELTLQTIIAAAVIIIGVVIITMFQRRA